MFEMSGIRAGRAKPGLLRQHLTACGRRRQNLRRAGERRRTGLAAVAFYAGADSRRRVPFRDWQRGQLYAGAAKPSCLRCVCRWFIPRECLRWGRIIRPRPAPIYLPRLWLAVGEMCISQRTTLAQTRLLSGRRRRGGDGRRTGGVFTRSDADIARRDVVYHRRSFAGLALTFGEREVATPEALLPAGGEKRRCAGRRLRARGNALSLAIQSEQLTELLRRVRRCWHQRGSGS